MTGGGAQELSEFRRGPGLLFDCSTLGIDRSRGAMETNATFRCTRPRRTASAIAPRITMWMSYAVFGASACAPFVGWSSLS